MPILAVVVILALGAGIVIIMIRSGHVKGGNPSKEKWVKGRNTILKEANRRLAKKPQDPEALAAVGDVYFQEESWDKAYKTYEILVAASELDETIDKFQTNLRYAIAALKLGQNNLAYKGLVAARALRSDNFEVNCNLGILEFQKKNYETALQLLKQAYIMKPEDTPMLRYLGHTCFKLGRYKEAMGFIRKAIDIAPDDKESLYVLGECYYEANQPDQALRIFNHLRADPVMGPSASLFSGIINMNQHQDEKAINDFEIGLKHENIKPEVLIELRYQLAAIYLTQHEIDEALGLLKQIQADNPAYKDVAALISKYQELNANKNLQIFTMAPSVDFVALCRKIVLTYYGKAKVKISNIAAIQGEWVDITADVDTPKWSDVVVFRFIRTQGSIGELVLRDFHANLKEIKAGKGICMAIGNFSDEAKRFIAGRLIDLIEKDRLMVILNTVDAKAQATSKKSSDTDTKAIT
ncbi:MAG: tetratricopeptide repeat protein [Treponema sp.]|nr:tetratricopeptide repeat protein [Treponema sp.]